MSMVRYLIFGIIASGFLFAQNTSTTARHIVNATSLPTTCSPNTGDIYFLRSVGPVGTPYFCSSPNTWTAFGTGSSSGGGGGGTNLTTELSGCGVDWSSGTLTVTVGACTYLIAGVQYSSPLTSITLMAADMTNPRLDLIIVDNTGTASALTGTAAMTPVAPNANPATQLALSVVFVPANATAPGGITTTLLYDEDTGGPGEWTAAATAHFTLNSTNNPYHLTHDIEATAAVLNNNFTLTKPSAGTIDPAAYSTLVFYIRSKATWPTANSGANAARFLTLWFSNGATQKGVQVILKDGMFNFSSSATTGYQQISIPLANFNANGIPVTTLNINVAGNTGTSSIGFYIDLVTLQSGAGTVIPATNPVRTLAGASFGSFQAGASALSGSFTACTPAYPAATIQAVEIIANASGNATIDVLTVPHASWTGTASATSITGTAVPALVGAASYSNTSLAGVWTTAVSANTDFCFALTSPSGVAGVSIALKGQTN